MNLLSRAIVGMQFRFGVYRIHQIIRIESGGEIISSVDSRYQPDGGIRYELTPDQWFLYSWRFFPRNLTKEYYDEEILTRECYYNYFNKNPGGRSNLYSIFKKNHQTGYMLIEHFDGQRGPSYYGIHINDFGFREYKTVYESGLVKPIEYATNPAEAAICMLSDLKDFESEKVDFTSLQDECEKYPGSCVLHSKLSKLLKECKHSDRYLNKGLECQEE